MSFEEEWKNRGAEWALVTGACSGIGLAIAEKLASLGYNLVIVSMNGPELEKVKNGFSRRYDAEVKVVEMDLSRAESAGILHDRCMEMEIVPLILVNNAGVFSYNDILETDTGRIAMMLGLHVYTLSMLCRLFGEDMAARGKGFILNMSSYSMWMPWPGLALYSATKSYIRNFSRSLAGELRENGIGVTTVLPGGVTTGFYGLPEKLQKTGKGLGILLTAEKTAEISLSAMFRRKKQCVPGFGMRLMLPLVEIMPGWAIRAIRRKTLRFQK